MSRASVVTFDWMSWFHVLATMVNADVRTDFSTTLLPLFRAAPPPTAAELPYTDEILIWALDMHDKNMSDFLFKHIPRHAAVWRDTITAWPSKDAMRVLDVLQRDFDRFHPIDAFVRGVPKHISNAFESYTLTREAALVMFEIKQLNDADGDKAIRHRVASMLITSPVKVNDDSVVIDGVTIRV